MATAVKQSMIFDIKRYAINDGPGIRVAVFFKGCPLSCQWCHNPEGMSEERQKMYNPTLCIGARECILVCQEDALSLTPDGIVTNMERCTLCGDCADACPTRAIEMSGDLMAVEEIMEMIRKDLELLQLSGGGVTFSGGEPLYHPRLLMPLIDACKAENIHVCIDTSGLAGKKLLLDVATKVDLFLYDLKIMDPDKHKKYTGVDNKVIIDNLIALAASGSDIVIRIPMIAGVNDGKKDIIQFATFIASLPPSNKSVQILPYHHTALNKHRSLGNQGADIHFNTPAEETLLRAIDIFSRYGVNSEIGG